MALVQARISAQFLDGSTVKAGFEQPLLISDASLVSALPGAWTAFLTAIEGVTDGQILGGTIAFKMPASATGGRPGADSNVQQTGVFTYNNSINPALYGVDVPTLADAVLTTDHSRIDVGNAAVIAWDTYLTGAVLGGNYTNREYNVLHTRTGTLKSFRKYRKRTAPRGRTIG